MFPFARIRPRCSSGLSLAFFLAWFFLFYIGVFLGMRGRIFFIAISDRTAVFRHPLSAPALFRRSTFLLFLQDFFPFVGNSCEFPAFFSSSYLSYMELCFICTPLSPVRLISAASFPFFTTLLKWFFKTMCPLPAPLAAFVRP